MHVLRQPLATEIHDLPLATRIDIDRGKGRPSAVGAMYVEECCCAVAGATPTIVASVASSATTRLIPVRRVVITISKVAVGAAEANEPFGQVALGAIGRIRPSCADDATSVPSWAK